MRQITVSYPSVQYSSVTSVYGTVLTLRNRFLTVIGSQMLVFEYRR